MRRKKVFILWTAFLSLMIANVFLCAKDAKIAESSKIYGDSRLASGEDSRVWVYYWWLKGNVSEELITRDLEAMHSKGIGGVLLVDSRGYYDDANTTKHVPVPLEIKYEYMSPDWRRMVTHLVKEAHRLGMQVSMNIANTGGQLRGPWDLGKDGPKELIWTEENVNGPKTVEIPLEIPSEERFFEDVAIAAVRITSQVSEGREAVKLNETWGRAATPAEDAPTADAQSVVDLKNFVQTNENCTKTLRWVVPEGSWKILRFGSRVVGDVGSVDILSREAVTRYFGLMCGQILGDVGDLAGRGKTLTHFYNVSWEGSDPNWTPGFAERFEKQNGYELVTKLPILRGLILGGEEASRRFCEDYFRTVSDAFRENCYLTIGELCEKHGMVWHSEDGGPWSRGKNAWMGNFKLFAEADMLTFWGQNDVIQGEFWVSEPKEPTTKPYVWPLTRSNARYASMAAHIYGKTLVSMESFTHMVHHWSQYPAHLKPAADENFADGANMFIWHTFTASPNELGRPGFEYFAGTHINTNVTWWNESSGIFRYIELCQKRLRTGTYVADVCVYTSDKNYIGWGHGESWNPDSKLVPGAGWKYDLLDTNVLVNRLAFRESDRRLVLPHGMSYKILVIDPLKGEPIPVEALEKALKLAEAGAVVVLGENIPQRNPGLRSFSQRDARLADVCGRLWKNMDSSINFIQVGKGRIYRNVSMEEVLNSEKILPDFEGDAHYIHLEDASEDRYFVAGSGTIDAVFRASGIPEIYDPLTDETRPALAYSGLGDGRTRVTLPLAVNGSAFVTFRKTNCLCAAQHFTSIRGISADDSSSFDWDSDDSEDSDGQKAQNGLNGQNGLKFRFWTPVRYILTNSKGEEKLLEVSEAEFPEEIDLSRDWTLRFAPNLGAPEGDVHFDTLTYWNENEDPGIRFFSGTCTYTKKFTVSDEALKHPVRLSLGEVNHTASIRINGKNAGIVWTAPWVADLTDFLKEGENTVEIDVTNVWANRLIGDAACKKEERISRTNVFLLPTDNGFKRYQGFFAADKLTPSGLIGPVKVQFGVEKRIPYE